LLLARWVAWRGCYQDFDDWEDANKDRVGTLDTREKFVLVMSYTARRCGRARLGWACASLRGRRARAGVGVRGVCVCMCMCLAGWLSFYRLSVCLCGRERGGREREGREKGRKPPGVAIDLRFKYGE